MAITRLPVEVLNDCADYTTDPANPALRTSGVSASSVISGGGGSGVSVTTVTTPIAAADSTREELLIVNTGSVDCYVNHGSSATLANFLLKAGAALPLSGGLAKRAWNGITSAGTAQLHIITGTV